MPSASQTSRLRSTPPNQRGNNHALMVSIQADLAALRATIVAGYTKLNTDIAAQRTAIVAVNAKLDLDSGVTGTDFASLHDPAALTALVAPAALGTTT